MIKINFINENNYQFDFNPLKIIKKITKEIAKKENLKKKHCASIIIIDNEKIHIINKEYRNIDRATDVISFACIDDNKDRILDEELGDIFISYEKIIEQANEYQHSILREFSFLVTHGLYHLLGFDHQTKEDEKVMFTKQEEVLNKVGITR